MHLQQSTSRIDCDHTPFLTNRVCSWCPAQFYLQIVQTAVNFDELCKSVFRACQFLTFPSWDHFEDRMPKVAEIVPLNWWQCSRRNLKWEVVLGFVKGSNEDGLSLLMSFGIWKHFAVSFPRKCDPPDWIYNCWMPPESRIFGYQRLMPCCS